MVETVPTSGWYATNMYETVLEAGKERRDEEMITRLLGVPNADLVACDARYHRKKGYVNPKCNAQAFEKGKQTTVYKEIIRQIIHEHRDATVSDTDLSM